jgi:hypothetical protein
VIGIAAKNESDIALGKASSGVGDGFGEELIVAPVRVRVERNRRKENDDGLSENVRGFDCEIQGRIVEGALRTLHPVDDADALAKRLAGTPDSDARIFGELFEFQAYPVLRSLGQPLGEYVLANHLPEQSLQARILTDRGKQFDLQGGVFVFKLMNALSNVITNQRIRRQE